MAKKPIKRRAKKAAVVKTIEQTSAELKQFSHPDEAHPGFSFTRYWYSSPFDRSGISAWVRKKLQPGDDPRFGSAAKFEVLLPPTAPSDFLDVDHLTGRYDQTLPDFQHHAMIQVKLGMDHSRPWHASYENIRAYAKAYFASQFPVILVAHVPGSAALEGYGNHVHCIVLARKIGPDGLAGVCRKLCSDNGYRSALAAWRKFFDEVAL